MKTSESYLPEGSISSSNEIPFALRSIEDLRKAQDEKTILEATAIRCNASHDLVFDFGCALGIMPRSHAALGIAEGETREIAILSRVGKKTCFVITELDESTKPPTAWLSRTIVQRNAQDFFLSTLSAGDIIPAKVTHLEPFGAFVDIGCGIPSLIGIENLSVSRILHPSDRFSIGQDIFAVVRQVDKENRRISLSHRELLGTWEENAALFTAGETVRGIVRSIEPYGVFIELTPNLSGLAEPHLDLSVGQIVSVYIKSILPERMKIKLTVIAPIAATAEPDLPAYFLSNGHIDEWIYTPDVCEKKYISTIF